MTLSVKLLVEYLDNVKDTAHALSDTKILYKGVYFFKPLRQVTYSILSRWFNLDTVTPPIIETLLSYDIFTTLYPKDIFLDC